MKDQWNTATFVTNYLPLMLFPVLYIGARLWFRCVPHKPEDMDFVSGLKEVEAASYDEPPPRNWLERFWGWLVSSHSCPTRRPNSDTNPLRRCKKRISMDTIPSLSSSLTGLYNYSNALQPHIFVSYNTTQHISAFPSLS